MDNKMDYKVKEFRRIVNEMADLYEKKNRNYGDSFGQLYEALGPISGLVPLHNKLDRATNLVKGGENNFESLEDTLKDLACYAVMNLIEMYHNDSEDEENDDEDDYYDDDDDDYYDDDDEDHENNPINNNEDREAQEEEDEEWHNIIGAFFGGR